MIIVIPAKDLSIAFDDHGLRVQVKFLDQVYYHDYVRNIAFGSVTDDFHLFPIPVSKGSLNIQEQPEDLVGLVVGGNAHPWGHEASTGLGRGLFIAYQVDPGE